MKKCWIAALMLSVFLLSCASSQTELLPSGGGAEESVLTEEPQTEAEKETETETEPEGIESIDLTGKEVYSVSRNADYAVTAQTLPTTSDLVVRVRYLRDVSQYAKRAMPVLVSEFEVLEVYKGDCAADTVTAGYYGGELPRSEIIKYFSDVDREAREEWLAMPQERQEQTVIVYDDPEIGVSFDRASEYILFAKKTAIGGYLIGCDRYGAPRVEGDTIQVFGETFTIEQLKQIIAQG